MLYETITKILNKGKTEDKDLLVARDMLVKEDPSMTDELYKASDVLRAYYREITSLRNAGDEANIQKLCTLIESGDEGVIKDFIKELDI